MRRLKKPYRYLCGQMVEIYHRFLGDDIFEQDETGREGSGIRLLESSPSRERYNRLREINQEADS